MSQAINIPSTVGGNTAYVGFTGGTGGLSASQKLLSWTYSTQSVPPTFTPAAGTYSTAQNVSLSSATSSAAIYYTTNGSLPTAASTRYSSPIPVTASETINAIAISSTYGSSNAVSGAYVISPATASFSLSATSFTIGWRGGSIHIPIAVTPSGGFTGKVPLTCIVTGLTGATSIPTCAVSTQPSTIKGTSAVTGYLFIQTQTTTTLGNYVLKVQGVYGNLTESVSVPFTVN